MSFNDKIKESVLAHCELLWQYKHTDIYKCMEIVIKFSTVLILCWRLNNKLVRNVGFYDRLDFHLEVIHKILLRQMKRRHSAVVIQSVRNTPGLSGYVCLSVWHNSRISGTVRLSAQNTLGMSQHVRQLSSTRAEVCVRVEFNQFKHFLWHHNPCYCVRNTAAYMKLYFNFVTMFNIQTKKPDALLRNIRIYFGFFIFNPIKKI